MKALKVQKSETFAVEVQWISISGRKNSLICKPHHIGTFGSYNHIHLFKLNVAKPFTTIVNILNKVSDDYCPRISLSELGSVHLEV